MKAIIRKLLRDFWRSKSKFFLCVLASGICAWGISGVIYSYLMSERDFSENFFHSNPADFVMTIKKPDDHLLRVLREDAAIRDIERREIINARIKTKTGGWMPFTLFAVEDPGRPVVSKFTLLEEESLSKRKDGLRGSGIFIENNGGSF